MVLTCKVPLGYEKKRKVVCMCKRSLPSTPSCFNTLHGWEVVYFVELRSKELWSTLSGMDDKVALNRSE